MIRPADLPESRPSDPGPPSPEALDLSGLLDTLRGRPAVVLSGAGCSTESGIPDYRGPEGRFRTRAPIRYREFVEDSGARRRYWARSAVGWPRFSAARPNAAHDAIARLEDLGAVRGVITQNVDGLHQAAGSGRVLELHGSLARVRCLDCTGVVDRARFQERLLDANPDWAERVGGEPAPDGDADLAPDGDAEVPDEAVRGFRVPGCLICGGVLKPDVVFFGESVPPERVGRAWELFGEAGALLVVGSSLAVYSGRRFIYRAREEGVPIAVVNLGPTRADELAAAKVEGKVGEVLPRLAGALAAD